MLVNWQDPKHVYIVCGKTDLRKGIDGLAIVVQENYGLGLFDDSLFLFWSPVNKIDNLNRDFFVLCHD
ncbi:IS66 family insertion sequence element accessory protein TnpB [Limosilactobacillus fermentum]|uniref:IS66 family insertion sequence element accessory protein TnpB n=1 Tax=Limosilactobacillus fermentum TaxID=1613 RepID=UPI003D2E5F9F